MAANMFVVNEMSAMEEEYEIQSTGKKNKNSSISHILDTASGPVLYWENTINLAKGLFSLVLITIFDGGIIMQEDIGSLDVLDGDQGGS